MIFCWDKNLKLFLLKVFKEYILLLKPLCLFLSTLLLFLIVILQPNWFDHFNYFQILKISTFIPVFISWGCIVGVIYHILLLSKEIMVLAYLQAQQKARLIHSHLHFLHQLCWRNYQPIFIIEIALFYSEGPQ